jgi:hypothetical protein
MATAIFSCCGYCPSLSVLFFLIICVSFLLHGTLSEGPNTSTNSFLYENCGAGNWVNASNDNLYYLFGSRVQQQPNLDVNANLNNFFAEACPAESLLRACYFHTGKDPTKIQSLERRVFKPNNPQCKQFQPLDFLEMLRNRRLILYGDSIMSQIFSAFVCALYRLTTSSYGMDFVKLWKGQCNEINCPFGKPQHSLFAGGWINFPVVNVSIIQITASYYGFKEFEAVLHQYAPLSSHDIILYNFGMHYNNETEYGLQMTRFAEDMKTKFLNTSYHWHRRREEHESLVSHGDAVLNDDETDETSTESSLVPELFFIESSPQHFDSPLNGYYKQETNDYHKDYCDATTDMNLKYEHDWRNRIAEKALINLHPRLHYIPMAYALYSQYDAHVGLEPLPYAPIDCTHWCYPSNIFKYMHMIIFNSFRKNLLPLLQTSQTPSSTATEVNMLPPRIKNGMIVKALEGPSIYLIDNGKLREFQSWNAFVKRGYDMSKVHTLPAFQFMSMPMGEGLQ